MPNRLAQETSPYLRQHANNPVDWYPWGEEAIARARELDRPIFLSIGYSACHWCHVMEHESFENDEIAAIMNAHFVCIKVDREERPDLDQIYMTSVQMMTGHGGWPMSVFLTPDLQPFYGGTYWPPEPRFHSPGFRNILLRVHEAWEQQRENLVSGAKEVTERIRDFSEAQGAGSLDEEMLKNAGRVLVRAADTEHGGFGGAPKFPHPMDIRLLLRVWKRFDDADAMRMALLALEKMAAGGIYDHLGGGFHRYSTDAKWLVPHFEKMLYDNALLIPAYLEAFQATGRDEFATVVRETAEYVLREMTQPEGGFYSTQDADSEGVEGKFFVWTPEEVVDVLGEDEAAVFMECYDVHPGGNWEGKSILNRPRPLSALAAKFETTEQALAERLASSREKLLEARSQRVPPGRDEKVLVSWNGLMIGALARAGALLEEPRYVEAAERAADFILENVRDESGRLLHSFKDGRARFQAYLDDFASLIDGLVELYEATFDATRLDAAIRLTEEMLAAFDDRAGGLYYTAADHEKLIVRTRDTQDSAVPSGSSMAACALLRLGHLTGRTELVDRGVKLLETMAHQLQKYPMGSGQALLAVDFALGPAYEIALAGGTKEHQNERCLRAIRELFLPNKVVAFASDAVPQAVAHLFEGRAPVDGQPAAYICREGACQAPAVGAETIAHALRELE